MRRKLKIITLVFGLHCMAANALNTVCSRVGPITECGEGVLDSLHVAGKATLSGTRILNQTRIAGMLLAENAQINMLRVSGMAMLYGSEVKGQSKISGMLNACHSVFAQKIQISSDRMHLSGVTTGSIEMDPGGDRQVICLGNKSTVKGDIVFASGQGLVAMDSSSRITGKVTGGKIDPDTFNTYCEGDQTC